MNGFLLICLASGIIALLAGLILRSKGYTFIRSFITFFLAAAGLLGLLYKLIGPYL